MAVYPSGAPLPRFHITRVIGKLLSGYPDYIEVQFTTTISNWDEFRAYFTSRGCDLSTMLFFLTKLYGRTSQVSLIHFTGDANDHGGYAQFSFVFSGSWVDLDFSMFKEWSYNRQIFTFPSPLHFCDLYLPSTLSQDVWTDLQFTQGNGPSMSSLLGVGIILGLMGLGYYLWKRK